MARPKNDVPTYRLHFPSGTAHCWVTLGRYNSPESRAEYTRILAELAPPPPRAVPGHARGCWVVDLLLGKE